MRVILIFLCLFFVTNCEAQTQFPKQLPKKLVISFNRDGGMLRAYYRITIKDRDLKFEELKGGDRQPEEWNATLSEEDLTKLYNAFVENRFDTIKNDKPTQMATDAISETISIMAGERASVQVTYGRNSPLSGKNLERYQAVSRAINDLASRCKDRVR